MNDLRNALDRLWQLGIITTDERKAGFEKAIDKPAEDDAGEGWRLLNKGESLQPGDEMQSGDGAWQESTNAKTGAKPSPLCRYRRRIAPDQPTAPDPATDSDLVVGHWYHSDHWGRALCVSEGDDDRIPGFAVKLKASTQSVDLKFLHAFQVTPLPDCTGWDWQPPYTPPTTWQRTADRPPTEADGDAFGDVMTTVRDEGRLCERHWSRVSNVPGKYVEWIPTAALLSACRSE